MIFAELGTDLALGVVAAVMVVVVGWGVTVSSRTAAIGPAWAMTHLRLAIPAFGLLGLVGVAGAFFVSPRWVGLTVTYVAAVGWWLATTLRRSLARVSESGGFGEVSAEFRRAVIKRTQLGLALAAGAALVGGVLVPPPVAKLALAVLAVVLVANIAMLDAKAPSGGDR